MGNEDYKDTIEYFKRNNYIVSFIKFGKYKYIKDLCDNGHIYMNNEIYFRQLENEQLNKGQGDKNQGRIMDSCTFKLTKLLENGEVADSPPFIYPKKDATLLTSGKHPLFSMHAVRINDCDQVEENTFTYKIPWDHMKNLKTAESNDTSDTRFSALIIHEPYNFLLAILKKAKEKGYDTKDGFVEYVKNPNQLKIIKSCVDNQINANFYKDDFYINQREYIIVFNIEVENALDDFFISAPKDYCELVDNPQDNMLILHAI